MNTPLLDKIESPADLRKLPENMLPALCEELRDVIVSELSENPGHFASSMGAVEIAVALHYVFNTPDDRIVWDVGHQAYAHKLLTGRREAFHTQRKLGGISGFPNPSESEYDTFTAGHASNSISAALGMAIGDQLSGHGERKSVAVIGDASIGTGLAFEGLNNASTNPNDLLIILNDNDHSIDENVGAMHKYLSEVITSRRYNKLRYDIYNALKRRGGMSDHRKNSMQRLFNSLKAFISRQQNIFEGLNIRYFGPFDGHDVQKMVKTLRDIKDMKGPRILHLRTRKGKGYEAAESDPTTWHAPGKFDAETGERAKGSGKGPLKWQEVFGRTLVELADRDERIVGITAAMPTGTSMNLMLEKYPERSFDVGISEGHAVTFAGGLAVAGKRPFVAIYSGFLQRSYDNIINDVCIEGLPVTFCIDRAGIVGEDGVTHHGMFDLAYLRAIPGMKVASPMDERTLRNIMHTSLELDGPLAVRYPRGSAVTADWQTPFESIEPGKGRKVKTTAGARVAVVTIGPIGNDALRAINELEAEGVKADLYDMIWLKPLDTDLLAEAADNHSVIVTIEDGTLTGGLGSAVKEFVEQRRAAAPDSSQPTVVSLGVPDQWVSHGTVRELRAICGYDFDSIKKVIKENAQE